MKATSDWTYYQPSIQGKAPAHYREGAFDVEYKVLEGEWRADFYGGKPGWFTTDTYRLRLKAAAPASTGHVNSLPEDERRSEYPMADGLLDYFPNALAEVSRVSYIGNQKHNPGEAMHWARGKSTDHRNKIGRHLIDAGGFEDTEVDGKPVRVRHSAYLAWRALANLQEELEREEGFPLSRGSTPPETK